MMTTHLTYILLFCLKICFAAKQCFYPNGEESSEYPCDPDLEDSPCCGGYAGSICLSNKLCKGGNGNIIRASCTDQSWDSTLCPKFCTGASTGGTDLISCSNVTDHDTTFCCDHSIDCCETGAGRFDVLPPDPQVWATWFKDATQFLVVGSMYTGLPSTTLSLASTETAPMSTSTTKAPTDDDPSLSTGAQAGIGFGAAIGGISIAVAIYLLFRKRHAGATAIEGSSSSKEQPVYSQQQMMDSRHGHNLGVVDHHNSRVENERHPQELPDHGYSGYRAQAELPTST